MRQPEVPLARTSSIQRTASPRRGPVASRLPQSRRRWPRFGRRPSGGPSDRFELVAELVARVLWPLFLPIIDDALVGRALPGEPVLPRISRIARNPDGDP